ncbi:nuclease [Ganoderma leucocontextum]|nr:nuclease [Ganoderma leucocontextum]
MPWIPWGPSSPPQPQSTREHIDHYRSQLQSQLQDLQKPDHPALLAELEKLPPYLLLALGAALGLAADRGYARYLKRIPSSEWVTPNITKSRRWIKGYVTKVGDSDNFRLYHTPGIGWMWPLKKFRIPSKGLKGRTLAIRIAGVDAPELSHWGKPAQPFAQESLQWLKDTVEGKIVYCQLLQHDQYRRIVATAYLKPRFLPGWLVRGKSVGLEMLREGWGAVYKEAGLVYGKEGEAAYLRLEKEAQEAKRGMWQNGIPELPSEYKRRHREGGGDVSDKAPSEDDELAEPAIEELSAAKNMQSRSWLSRLFGR